MSVITRKINRYYYVTRKDADGNAKYLYNHVIMGSDKENVLRMKKTTWCDNILDSLTLSEERAVRELEGIEKYCKEDGYTYCITVLEHEYIVREAGILNMK